MRFFLVLLFAVVKGAAGARAENATPCSGTQRVETGSPIDAFVGDLKSAIAANKMGIVAKVCANCGAESLGLTIPGNSIVMIFHPRLAIRTIEASVAAGIEAPLRLYVAARLTHRLA